MLEAIHNWFVRRVIRSLNLMLQLMAVIFIVQSWNMGALEAIGDGTWGEDSVPDLLFVLLHLVLG